MVTRFRAAAPQAPAAPPASKERAHHEILHLLRDADLRADAREGGADLPRLPRAGGARRRARLPLRLGGRAPRPVRVLALVGAGGVPRRSSPRAPRRSASATASRSCRIATTTRSASPSASPRSTSCRAGGSTGARASRRRSSSSRRSRTSIGTLHDQWLEAMEMIPRMWSADVFSHEGRFFKMPPTQIAPEAGAAAASADVRRLHQARQRRRGRQARARRAQLRLRQRRVPDAEGAASIKAAVGKAQPVGRKKTDWFACTPATLVLDDDRKACAYGMRGARFFGESLARYYLAGNRPIGKLDVPRDFISDADLDDVMAAAQPAGHAGGGDRRRRGGGEGDGGALRRHRRRRAHPASCRWAPCRTSSSWSRCGPSPRR